MDKRTLEERIAQVDDMRSFASGELGLDLGGIFTKMDLSDRLSYYWVWVSRRDRIAPPRGLDGPDFFREDLAGAREWRKELDEAGYDTCLQKGEAYGGVSGSCPLTLALLKDSATRRAYLVFHEGFHVHIRRHMRAGGKKIPLWLEEPLADYVGEEASLQYAERHNRRLLHHIRDYWDEEDRFTEFVNTYHRALSECYTRGGEGKERILRKAKTAALEFTRGGSVEQRKRKLEKEINNAYFLDQGTYTLHAPLVRAAFEEARDDLSLEDYLADPDPVNAKLIKAARRLRHG